MFKTIFLDTTKLGRDTNNFGRPARECLARPGPSNESGVDSCNSEVYCIIGSICLFGFIEITT